MTFHEFSYKFYSPTASNCISLFVVVEKNQYPMSKYVM